MAAGADDRPQRLLEPVLAYAGTYNYEPDHRPARHPGLHPRPRPGTSPASATAATRSWTSVPTSTSICIRPQVTGVTATETSRPRRGHARSTSTRSAARLGQSTRRRWTINITFSGPIDPSTLNANTVQLVDLGIATRPTARPVHQPVRQAVSTISATDTLVINLGAAGLTLATDAYQIYPLRQRLAGDHQPQGVALDGENSRTATPRQRHATRRFPRATATPAATSTTRSSSTPRRRRSWPARSQMTRPATPTSSATTSPRRPRPRSTARSASPTRTWCPLAGQTAILDIGIASSQRRRRPTSARASSPPTSPVRPVHPPERRHRG